MRLGLALSGGGTRAAIFHLGVLARFAKGGFLESVSKTLTVSGGSLVTALIISYADLKWPSSKQYLEKTYPALRALFDGSRLIYGYLAGQEPIHSGFTSEIVARRLSPTCSSGTGMFEDCSESCPKLPYGSSIRPASRRGKIGASRATVPPDIFDRLSRNGFEVTDATLSAYCTQLAPRSYSWPV
jgi:hypothetical protein